MATGYARLPAYRAPASLDFRGLNQGIDQLGEAFEKNRLLDERKEIGEAVQSGDYGAGAKAAYGQGNLKLGLSLDEAQRQRRTEQRQSQLQDWKLKKTKADIQQGIRERTGRMARYIKGVQDPDRKAQLAQRFFNSHPRFRQQLDASGVDMANPDTALDYLIAEAGFERPDPVKVGKDDRLVNPQTGREVYTPPQRPNAGVFDDPEKRVKYEQSLRKEHTKNAKTFRDVRDAMTRVERSVANPSPAGDMALIFNYMKLLDPGSVVRESEFATAAESGSYGQQIQGYVNRVMNGQRLADSVRQDFLQRARSLYEGQENQFKKTRDQFRTIAERAGIEPDDVVLDLLRADENIPQPDSGQRGAPDTGSQASEPSPSVEQPAPLYQPEPPSEAIGILRNDPSSEARAEFDEVFGEGAAARVLGDEGQGAINPPAGVSIAR